MRVLGMLALVFGLAIMYEVGPKGLTLDQAWTHLADVLHLSNIPPASTQPNSTSPGV